MSEKVRVSREIAEYIEGYPRTRDWENKLLVDHAYQYFTGSYADVSLKNVSPLGLSKILIYGYEVEQTPEEKLLQLYKDIGYDIQKENSAYDRGMRNGICEALRILGIQIEGVNKHDY